MARYVFETLTLDAITPVALSTTRIGGIAVRRIWFTPATQPVRLRWDGGAPSATVGHHYAVNVTHELAGADAIQQVQFIATMVTATVDVTGEAA